MGAGRSIAVQNFDEQVCILALGSLSTVSVSAGLSAFGAMTLLGGVVIAAMLAIQLWHRANLRRHPTEIRRLLRIARQDPHQ
jgi:hypothetical protein